MKKAIILLLTVALILMLPLNALAVTKYNITDKLLLSNFETGDPLENMAGGSTAWGGHWIDTTITSVAGLEGKTALQLAFGSSDTGTIGGFQSNSIGIFDVENDWSVGKALLYRIKNTSTTSLNVATTIDVVHESSRARVWQNGTQILLDTNYNPVTTVYADALANDGVTKAGMQVYVTIPAGFDGYLLWDLSKATADVPQPYEAIPFEGTVDLSMKKVLDFVLLFQDCMNKACIIDDFRLVDYTVEEIADVVPEEPAVPEAVADPDTKPAPAPKTGDFGLVSLIGLSLAAAVVFTKTRKSKA